MLPPVKAVSKGRFTCMKTEEKTSADLLEAAGVRLLDEEALRDWPPNPVDGGDEGDAEGRDGVEAKGGVGGKVEAAAEAGKASFLFFTAQWCRVCLESAPRFVGVFEKFRDRAEFRQVDADHAPVATERLGVRSVPAVVAFARGREIARRVGLGTVQELERFVEDAVKEAAARSGQQHCPDDAARSGQQHCPDDAARSGQRECPPACAGAPHADRDDAAGGDDSEGTEVTDEGRS